MLYPKTIYRAFDHVLQLSNISRPGIRLAQVVSRVLLLMRSSRSSFPPFLNNDGWGSTRPAWGCLVSVREEAGISIKEYVEAVIKVLAKTAGCDRTLQVAIGSGNHPYVRPNRVRSSNTLELPLLQDAEQRDLRLRRKFSDFVQEDCSSLGELEPAEAPLQGSGKSSLFVTK